MAMDEIVIFEDPEKGAGFAQMCHLLTYDNTISHGAYRTYATLLSFAMQGGRCGAGVDRLAAILDCSRQTVSGYLKELQTRGLIRRERNDFRGIMVTTICNLNRVYQDDPILNRFIELSGRFSGQLGFTTGDDTVVKQTLPQSSSRLDDSGKEDLTTDVKQALPEEEGSKNTQEEKEEEAADAASPAPQSAKTTTHGPDPPLQVFKPGMDFLDMASVTEQKQAEMRARGIDNPAEIADPLAGWSVNDKQVKEVLLEFIALSGLRPATKKKRKGWEAGARECLNVFDGNLDETLAVMRIFFRIRGDDGDDRFKFDICSLHSIVNSLGVIRDNGHERRRNGKTKLDAQGQGSSPVRSGAGRKSRTRETETINPDQEWADALAAYKTSRT